MRHVGRSVFWICLFASCGLLGCGGGDEPIVAYTVPKHESIQIPIETAAERPVEHPSHRLLAAIVLDDDTAWYFKSITPVEAFPAQATEAFDKLLRSLRLDHADKPSWDLDDSWTELPGSGMRVANLQLDNVEMAVSKLPLISDGSTSKYVLDNINRWRRQLQMMPVSLQQLDRYSTKLETADGHAITVVDYLGRLDASSLPTAGSRGGPSGSAATARQAPTELPIRYEVPATWRKQPPGMMQLATFEAGGDGKTATISVSQLGGMGGGVLANVNRWRRQVGLPPLATEQEIERRSRQVDGVDAVFLEFHGEQGTSIAVAMVPNGNAVWFFKMMGDTVVVDQEADNFQAFLDSITWN